MNSTGIKDPGGFMGMVGIYPNPNKGVFTIKGKTGLLNDEEMDVTLTDLLGQVVYAKKMMVHSGAIDEQVVCEHTLARGVYLLNLKGGEGVRVFRVLVE